MRLFCKWDLGAKLGCSWFKLMYCSEAQLDFDSFIASAHDTEECK